VTSSARTDTVHISRGARAPISHYGAQGRVERTRAVDCLVGT
jgi:hypothetical protein